MLPEGTPYGSTSDGTQQGPWRGDVPQPPARTSGGPRYQPSLSPAGETTAPPPRFVLLPRSTQVTKRCHFASKDGNNPWKSNSLQVKFAGISCPFSSRSPGQLIRPVCEFCSGTRHWVSLPTQQLAQVT